MFSDPSRIQPIGAWCAAMIVAGALGVAAGVDLTFGSLELLLAAGLVPPAVLLLMWHQAQPLSVADLPYAVNAPSSDARP